MLFENVSCACFYYDELCWILRRCTIKESMCQHDEQELFLVRDQNALDVMELLVSGVELCDDGVYT